MDILLACLLSGATTWALISSLTPLAHRAGLVDEPSARKIHSGRIALVGGIALFCGFWIGALTLDVSLHDYRPFLAASSLLVVVGMLDDFRELTPRARINAQVAAALIMIAWAGLEVNDLGRAFTVSPLTMDAWALPFTLVGVVGAINAMNLIDGIDGLCGGLAVVCLTTIAVLSWEAGAYREFALPMVLITSVVVFLRFNLCDSASTKVFLGDAGSMFLGFAAAWLLADASQGNARVMSPVTTLWVFAVPLIDTSTVMIRRLFRLRSPLRGDHTHLHHLLLAAGFSRLLALGILLSSAALMAVIGVAGMRLGVSDRSMLVGFAGVFLVVLVSTMWRAREVIHRHDGVLPDEAVSSRG